jgi:putative nucleotidyltransferase with HDIG domain
VRRDKIAALSKKLTNLDQKTLDIYAALSNASQMVVAGGLDPSVVSHVKASAAYLVSNAIDSDLTVTTLSRMIVCDPTLYDHSATVAMIAAVIATRLISKKVSKKDAEIIAQGAMFHDVGKTCVPSEILNKPGKFNPAEFEIMKTHTSLGYEEMQKIMNEGAPLDQLVARIALEHHEKWDGKGYPHGRKGAFETDHDKGIHLFTRIVTVADVYSALLMKRVYKPAFEPQDAIKIMVQESRGYDPEVFVPFLKCVVRSLNTEQKHHGGGRLLTLDDEGGLSEWHASEKSA